MEVLKKKKYFFVYKYHREEGFIKFDPNSEAKQI